MSVDMAWALTRVVFAFILIVVTFLGYGIARALS